MSQSEAQPLTTMKRTAYLLAMRVAGLVCLGATKFYLAATLPDEDFGRYALFFGFVSVTFFVFEFGFFQATARASAFREGREFHRLVGFVAVGCLPIYALYLGALVAIVAAANSLDKIYFARDVWPALLLAPSAMLHYGLCQLCIASNRTRTLGMLQCLPYALSLVAAIVLHALGLLTYGHAALCYTGGLSASVIWGVFVLRPQFDGLWQAWNDTRRCFRYGRDMYISRVSAMGIYKLDIPLIALFLDFESVGYYTLARAVLMPFGLVTQSFASTRYKQYMASGVIPRFDLLAVYAYSALAVLAPLLLSVTVLPMVFGDKPAVFFYLVQVLSLRAGVQAVSMIYNMYFVSTGQSGLVLRVSIVTSVLNLILYLICIPVFGVLGVAIADVVDCATYYLMLLHAYARRRVAPTQEEPGQKTVPTSVPYEGADAKSVAA